MGDMYGLKHKGGQGTCRLFGLSKRAQQGEPVIPRGRVQTAYKERMSLQLCHMNHERATQDFIPDDIHFGSSPPQATAPARNEPHEHTVHDRTPSTIFEGDLDIHAAASAMDREDPSSVAEPPAEEESTWLGPVEGTQGSTQSAAAVQMRSGLQHLVSILYLLQSGI